MQKTIFITITRSFLTRNILRCGTLELLKKHGYKIFVFFPRQEIPAYLKQEFEDDQVKLVGIAGVDSSRLHRLFLKLNFSFLIYSKSAIKRALTFNENARVRFFSKAFLKKTKIIPWLRYLYLLLASHNPLQKRLYRFIEYHLFPQENSAIQKYFETYKPDVVFSTSSVSGFDVSILKEARRRGVMTVSMPKSWDNIALGYMRFVPDYFAVPNEHSQRVAVAQQDITEERVRIVGMPQFDWYARKDILRSKEEHFTKKGLDPALPLIFFGSEGVWASHDHEVAERVHEWIARNELAQPCQLLVRSHFSNADQDVFRALRDKDHVVVDSYRLTNFLGDKWDPSTEEMIDFVNTLYHCGIMINAASTLTLDAACFDKPIINIAFGCVYEGGHKDGEDITESILYTSDHFGWVMETGATSKADTYEELKSSINSYLENPNSKSEERRVLREKLCYKVDGRSSERLVAVLDEAANTRSKSKII